MFPASLTMFPLAATPAVHATLLSVDVDVVLGALVGAIMLLGASIAHRALHGSPARASARAIALGDRALRVGPQNFS